MVHRNLCWVTPLVVVVARNLSWAVAVERYTDMVTEARVVQKLWTLLLKVAIHTLGIVQGRRKENKKMKTKIDTLKLICGRGCVTPYILLSAYKDPLCKNLQKLFSCL